MTDTMRALVRSGGAARVERRPRRAPSAGEARLRVLLAGVCRTDLYTADGSLAVADGRVLGHELVAEVIESHRFERGARVAVHPWISGEGDPRIVGVDVDGAFAEELCVSEDCLHQVPKDLPLRRAAYVEPIAASMAVLQAPIARAERGAVLGAGRIATLTARILAHEGFSATQLATVTPNDRGAFDYVIETNERSLADAIALVRERGLVVLKSRPAHAVPFDLAAAVKKRVSMVAVAYASFADAIALAPKLALDDLLGDVYPLDRFATAFERAREASSPKLFLDPGAG